VVTEASLAAGLAAYLKSPQDGRRFPKSIHSVVLLSTIIGPTHFWFRYKPRYAAILQLNETNEKLDELFLKQFSRTLMSF